MKKLDKYKSEFIIEMVDIIIKESEAIKNIPITQNLIDAIDLIYQQVHLFKGKVVVTGMGKAGQIGHNIATTLSSTGTPSIFIHAAEAQHGDLGMIQENDILLLISNSGKTKEVIEFLELARNFTPNIMSIVITGNDTSELALKSDILLHTGNHNEVCPLNLTPTVSTTVMTVLGDIIVVQLMKKIKLTRSDYLKRHHGGYNGVLAKEYNNLESQHLISR